MTHAPVRPDFSDIDAWGVTHRGHARERNEDYFFVGGLGRRPDGAVVLVSVRDGKETPAGAERVASLAAVADGVGRSRGGAEGARKAVEGLVEALVRSFPEAESVETRDPEVFARLLHQAALSCHESLLERARRDEEGRRFATTLTLFLGLWPHAWLLQVGDSRCYVFQDGVLTQISRDQTFAQDLVDQGALTRTAAEKSRWANVLSSAIGGEAAAPVVSRLDRKWGSVILLCSDGLTKHVPDDRIRDRLASMTSAREVAEQLLEDALEAGGTDNVTIVVGRTVPRGESEA